MVKFVLRVTIVLLLSLCNVKHVTAQTSSDPASDWSLGIDFLSYLIKDQSKTDYQNYPRNKLIIKRRMGERGTLRFSPGLQTVNRLTSSATDTHEKIILLEVRPGYEFNKQYGKFQHSYGSDLIWKLISTNEKPYFNDTSHVIKALENYHVLGISIFTGGKYQLTKAFSISLETSISAFMDFAHTYHIHYDDKNNVVKREVINSMHIQELYFRTNPVALLYFSYFF